MCADKRCMFTPHRIRMLFNFILGSAVLIFRSAWSILFKTFPSPPIVDPNVLSALFRLLVFRSPSIVHGDIQSSWDADPMEIPIMSLYITQYFLRVTPLRLRMYSSGYSSNIMAILLKGGCVRDILRQLVASEMNNGFSRLRRAK